jgi:hypothetical protein
MTTIEVLFTGIVYLLGSDSSTVNVVLPNASLSASAPFGHAISDHFAYIKIARKYIDDASYQTALGIRAPDFLVQSPIGEPFVVYVLDGEQIDLAAMNMTPLPTKICSVPPCGTDRVIYANVAHRELICPGCGKLDQVYLSSKEPTFVSGRMAITAGRLSAIKPDTAEWVFQPAVSRFSNATYKHQAVAEKVALDVSADSAFTLALTRFDATTTIALLLQTGASVEIGNLPLADLVGLMLPCEESVDHHFGLYYAMLQRPVPHDPPIPHRVNLPTCPPTGGPRQNCPPLADEQP